MRTMTPSRVKNEHKEVQKTEIKQKKKDEMGENTVHEIKSAQIHLPNPRNLRFQYVGRTDIDRRFPHSQVDTLHIRFGLAMCQFHLRA